MAREVKNFCGAAIALAADSTKSSKVKERFLIIALFAVTLSTGRSDLPKEANFESRMPPGNSRLSLWLRPRK